jgi:phospholipase/carboxylesterase
MTLETIEVETGPSPDAAIIWLHGLGADGHDFEALVPELIRHGERAWRFVFPHAPRRPVTINGGMQMRAWYDVIGFDRQAAEDEAGMRASGMAVGGLIAREGERGIAASRIVLAGFSQGGAITLYAGPRYPLRLAGLMALSTYLPVAGRLTRERVAANDGVPVFMAHGVSDTVLPIALGLESRDILKGAGYAVEWHQYPMAHAVCAAEISDIRSYLFRVLP